MQALVTSREMLGLQAETVYPLGGLAYADAVGLYAWTRCDCSCTARSRPAPIHLAAPGCAVAAPRLRVGAGDAARMVLAATWVSTLSLPEIADEIACCPEFRLEMADAPPAIGASALFEPTWQRLTERRAVFIRLAVFPAGGASGHSGDNRCKPAGSAKPGQQGDSVAHARRALRIQPLRQLRPNVSTRRATPCPRRTHCAYYAGFLAECETDIKGGARQLAALAEIDEDFENIRLAWDGRLSSSRRTCSAGWRNRGPVSVHPWPGLETLNSISALSVGGVLCCVPSFWRK